MKRFRTIDTLLEQSKQAVRNERIALHLTQKEFADFVGLKYTAYRHFEQEGKISLESFLTILKSLNKDTAYENFLGGFEFESSKKRANPTKNRDHVSMTSPIIPPSQKQITLDKEIFGPELFYSVENGRLYEISNFIPIILASYTDERIFLLLRYFGAERLKPYILKTKNIDLLSRFNAHTNYLKKRN